MAKKMIFQAILAKTKPTNAENTRRVTLDGLGCRHNARLAEQHRFRKSVDKPVRAGKSCRKMKNTLSFFSTTGAVLAGPGGPSTPGGGA
jgi:hypothetical protein